MKIPSSLILTVLLLVQIVISSNLTAQYSLESQILYLHERLSEKTYWDKDQKFHFMRTWQHMKGIYQSGVHFNILDKRNGYLTAEARQDLMKIDDINMFVTSFVLYGLLQAESLGIIKVDHHKFSQSIQAIAQFRDKNTQKGIPQYSFWPQTYQNGTWTARSVNLLNVIKMSPSFPESWNDWLTKHGLGIFTMIKKFPDFFCIPPDNDDSGVNLALLGMMKQLNSQHFEYFQSLNYNKIQFYNRVLKYAYRPFEKNYPANKRCDEIDPRTYYILHHFIQKKKKSAEQNNETPSLILPTTWLLNLDQEIPSKLFMPFETNNVDATVSANFLFGLTYQVLTDGIKVSEMSSDLKKMVHDTVDLIEYVVQTLASQRLDLILVYYPSKYDFYWFVSRIVNLLKRYSSTKLTNEQYSDFKIVYERLSKLMKEQGTKNILKEKKEEPIKLGSNAFYWEEFLGNYGKKQRNQDALFSTALALNALLDTWTVRSGQSVAYDPQTPTEVKYAMLRAVGYLHKFISKQRNSKTGYKMKLDNAFFSGSMKIFKTSFPYFYPANVHFDKNGKNINPNEMELKDLGFGSKYYVKGYIESDEYRDMLSKKWFGSDVPTVFTGFNDGVGLTFPYWSSKAISEIMMITALSKYLRLAEGKNQLELISV